jgi:BolA protein
LELLQVIVVSTKFDNLPLLEQHRMVNEVLKQELANGVHALAIKTIPSSKWDPQKERVHFTTPHCLGGSKSNQQHKNEKTTPS